MLSQHFYSSNLEIILFKVEDLRRGGGAGPWDGCTDDRRGQPHGRHQDEERRVQHVEDRVPGGRLQGARQEEVQVAVRLRLITGQLQLGVIYRYSYSSGSYAGTATAFEVIHRYGTDTSLVHSQIQLQFGVINRYSYSLGPYTLRLRLLGLADGQLNF